METLIEQLKAGLNISGEEALEIMKAISEYVEDQHPLLKDLANDILMREMEKTKSV
ncbi:MAG TPA: hypothetical protein VFR58_16000 [Flavisolibacter sp.]|nr:hypothetical protein [Flavisolibacter sp.]